MILVLSKQDVRQAVTMTEAITAVEQAYDDFSAGLADIPMRTPVTVPTNNGLTLFMPGYIPAMGSLGLKVVSVFKDNYAKGKPTINGVFLLVDSETGEPLALMEASYLTALRTGAASGVAAKYLARPETPVAAIFGAGIQARTQLAAIHAVRRLREVRVYDPVPRAVEQYIRDMGETLADSGIEIRAAVSPEDAVRGADVVLTATTSPKPVFPGECLQPGAHVSGVGSYTPAMQEVDETTIRRADKIVVDSVEAALEEAGDLMIPLRKGIITADSIYGEIGEIIAGKKVGRERQREITFFKSVGLAVQDLAVARLVYDKAIAGNLGTMLDLG